MKEIIIAITVGVLTGAFTPIFYYQFIEKPKLKLEIDKLKLETFKSFTSFIPQMNIECFSKKINQWKWELNCYTKNLGEYPVNVELSDIQLTYTRNLDIANNPNIQKKQFYDYKCNKKNYTSSPKSNSYIGCDVYLSQKKYPNGIALNAAEAFLAFNFKTEESTQIILKNIDNFQGLNDYVNKISNESTRVIVSLQ